MLTQIAQIFPGVDPWDSFSVTGLQTEADGTAKGRIKADFFDWWGVGWRQVQANVDCMLIDGGRCCCLGAGDKRDF
jgi:hypothetical protein